jgi:hypothetical protein
MPNDETMPSGGQSPPGTGPSGPQLSPYANVSPYWATGERGRDLPSGQVKKEADNYAAPGSLEEDAAHLEAFRSYHSGFSNDARSTGEDSAPPNAEYGYQQDGGGDGSNYPKGRTRRTPRQQEQNKNVSIGTLNYHALIYCFLAQ